MSEEKKNPFAAEANPGSKVGNVIAVMSGKGGVGKSLVTSLCAISMAKQGRRAGILDADVTGPSIPHLFGIRQRAVSDGESLLPVESRELKIPVMSINILLEDTKEPVVWRGPVINGVVKQFWSDVAWGELDTLFVDMPPGTGDVPLTVYQSLPITGIYVVITPQELVSMVVEKAVRMAEKMQVPILGLIENMSTMVCPHCGEILYPFGEGRVAEFAEAHGIRDHASLPIDTRVASLCDEGRVEEIPEEFYRPLSGFSAKNG